MEEQYIVDGNLNHDGIYRKTGDTVMLTAEQAAPLLAIGRVRKSEQLAAQEQTASAAGQADGFPDHSLDPKPQEQAPASAPSEQPISHPQAPAAPEAPSAPSATEQAQERHGLFGLGGSKPAPAQPTQEQIDKDMTGL